MAKTYSVTLIRGDGTGPELALAAQRCVDAALAGTAGAGKINWRETAAFAHSVPIIQYSALDHCSKCARVFSGSHARAQFFKERDQLFFDSR